MRKTALLHIVSCLLLTSVPLATRAQTVFFAENFTNGSTIDSASPVKPTTNSTSYETISSKGWAPTPSISGHLKFGIGSTGGGTAEIQALFTTNAAVLVAPGDYIQLTIVFTNTSGLLGAGQNYLGIGLYNSESNNTQVFPVAGGLNGTATSSSTANDIGGAQMWQGYFAQVASSGFKHGIEERTAQTADDNQDQDLVTTGSSSESFNDVAATLVGSTVTSALTLGTNQTYTEVLNITLNGVNSLAISNSIYSGSSATGTPLAQFGGIATNTTFVTGAFDSLALGFYQKTSGPTNTLDIASITVVGSVTAISGPPTITSQPVPTMVTTNGSCAFSVSAIGYNMSYQWHRHGTNVSTGGNLTVINSADLASSMLVISPAGTADVAGSGADGYYVTVSGAEGYSTNSTTNSLSLVAATNLFWTGTGGNNVWDLDTTANWEDVHSNAQVFTCGDTVTFTDAGQGGSVDVTNSYTSAAEIIVDNTNDTYTFEGNGSLAGPGSLELIGVNRLTLNLANTYTGGTLISNPKAYLYLENYAGLGTGPVTMDAGTIEFVNAGSSTVGVAGDINVTGDSTNLVDNDGSFGAVFLGALTGNSSATLTMAQGPNNTGSTSFRIREYGANFTNNANLLLADSTVLFAPYQTSGNQVYNGLISGQGGIIHKATGTTYFNAANTYSGGFYLAIGTVGLGTSSAGSAGSPTSSPLGTGPLFLFVDSTSANPSGSGTLFGSGAGTCVIGNPIQYPSGTNNLTLLVGGTNSMTFTGPFTLNGNDNMTFASYMVRTIQATNTGGTTISGSISDNFMGYGLVQSGTGTLYLDGANTYTGPTTNSAGLLAGMGSLTSDIYVQTNSSIGGGSAVGIGKLSTSSNLTLNGNVFIRVNKSLSQPNDSISVGGTLNNIGTGTLTVTNLGPALAAGDRFVVFSAPLVNGSALTVTGAGLTWTNHLAVDGSIIAGGLSIATNSPYMTNTLSGTTLTLQWPSDHIGWLLQAQTNPPHGITSNAANWVTVSGANTTNKVIINIDPSKSSVFYRLQYP